MRLAGFQRARDEQLQQSLFRVSTVAQTVGESPRRAYLVRAEGRTSRSTSFIVTVVSWHPAHHVADEEHLTESEVLVLRLQSRQSHENSVAVFIHCRT
jgi:hypothetical protein